MQNTKLIQERRRRTDKAANTGSSSISTKDESRPSSSINDESGESIVDTTLSMLKMLLLGFISFLFDRKGKIPA